MVKWAVKNLLIWSILWTGIGGLIGVMTGGHAWQALPMLGAIYGVVGGVVFLVLNGLWRRLRSVSLIAGVSLGIVASLASVSVVSMLTYFDVVFALTFAIGAGALTGFLASLISENRAIVDARRGVSVDAP